MNLPFVLSAILCFDSPEHEVLQLSVSSEAPTHLNSDGGKKLRQDQWLISTILREINHLQGSSAGTLSAVPRAGAPS
jgi:hypothetical protein